MWHEARKQEKKLRGMLVDYRRRAERKKNYYNKIKSDPIQFMQVHGRPCKIFLDAAIAAAAEAPASMMPWQGDDTITIDRFDVRAHLDFIPISNKREDDADERNDSDAESRHIQYERYRIVAQNHYLNISEDKFLKQIQLEEQFGSSFERGGNDSAAEKRKKTIGTTATSGVAIGFNYAEPNLPVSSESAGFAAARNNDTDSDSDSDLDKRDNDFDLTVDASKLDATQASELNKSGCFYGMKSNDFYSFLINDIEEAENEKIAKEIEEEVKTMGRTRRERRMIRDQRLANKPYSPPSYAAKTSPISRIDYADLKESRSRSESPDNLTKITYITSFGDEENDEDNENGGGTGEASSDRTKTLNKLRPGSQKRSDRRSRTRSHSRSRNRRRDRGRNPKKSRSRSRSHSRSRNNRKHGSVRYRKRSTKSPSPKKNKHISILDISKNNEPKECNKSRSLTESSTAGTGSLTADSPNRLTLPEKSVSETQNCYDEKPKLASPPVRRYYGRGRAKSSSSELSVSDSEDNNASSNSKSTFNGNNTNPLLTNKNQTTSVSKGLRCSSFQKTIKPQEKLKLKMNALLNRQFEADKIAEEIKSRKAIEEKQSREEQLREMSSKLKEKQKKLKGAIGESESSSDSQSFSRSRSNSLSSMRARSRSSSYSKRSTSAKNNFKKRVQKRCRSIDSESERRTKSRSRSSGRDSSRKRNWSRSRNRRRSRSRSRNRRSGSRTRSPGRSHRSSPKRKPQNRSRSRSRNNYRSRSSSLSKRGSKLICTTSRSHRQQSKSKSRSPSRKHVSRNYKSLVNY